MLFLCFSSCCVCVVVFCFFFFQAEDGIRDVAVTGVQTCALPIFGQKHMVGHGVKPVQTGPTSYVGPVCTGFTPWPTMCFWPSWPCSALLWSFRTRDRKSVV